MLAGMSIVLPCLAMFPKAAMYCSATRKLAASLPPSALQSIAGPQDQVPGRLHGPTSKDADILFREINQTRALSCPAIFYASWPSQTRKQPSFILQGRQLHLQCGTAKAACYPALCVLLYSAFQSAISFHQLLQIMAGPEYCLPSQLHGPTLRPGDLMCLVSFWLEASATAQEEVELRQGSVAEGADAKSARDGL